MTPANDTALPAPAAPALPLPGTRVWRQLFHVAHAPLFVGALLLMGRTWTAYALGVGLLGAVLIDLARLRSPALNRVFFRAFRPFVSEREQRGPASSTWYLLGSLAAVAAFAPAIAAPAILTLGLADPAAAVVGKRWKSRRFGTGSVLGSAAFLLVALAVTVPLAGALAGAAAAVVATVVEAFSGPVDDNVTIPLSIAVVLWLAHP